MDNMELEGQELLDSLHPAQLEYLRNMVRRNVTFYPPELWDKAVDLEILERHLVNKGDREHRAILVIVEQARITTTRR